MPIWLPRYPAASAPSGPGRCQPRSTNRRSTSTNALCQDEAAARAALELPWSSGQTEGQITKLKLIKRQMFGRAKHDLFRAHVL